MDARWVILWINPKTTDPEYERFDTVEEAKKMLDEYSKGYPWNDYNLALIVETRRKTVKNQPVIAKSSAWTG